MMIGLSSNAIFRRLLPALAFASAVTAAGGEPPNVLLVSVDTLRADHLSTYGYEFLTSPHIDTLARDGVRFERAYTTIPLTGPAHFSLFTSRYPQEHGARRNGVAIIDDLKLVNLPELLGVKGYRTGAFISAWPLTSRLTHMDKWFHDYDEDLNRTYQLFNSSRWAEDVTPRALDWLGKETGKPFFLWVHYFDPHSPYDFREYFVPDGRTVDAAPQPNVGDEIRNRYRDYDSEINYTDHYIGKLLQAIDSMGLRESTLVVLLSDHGESLGEHDYVGHGRYLWESIIRIPLLMRWPGRIPAGKAVTTPVSLLDITPTIVKLTTGEDLKAGGAHARFAGRSLVPAFSADGKLAERPIFCVTFPGKKGFAPGWLARLWIRDEELPLRLSRIDGRTKSIWSPEDKEFLQLDLRRDPWELNPRRQSENTGFYRNRTGQLKKWFARTERRASQSDLSAHDEEVLKSLGYVQ